MFKFILATCLCSSSFAYADWEELGNKSANAYINLLKEYLGNEDLFFKTEDYMEFSGETENRNSCSVEIKKDTQETTYTIYSSEGIVTAKFGNTSGSYDVKIKKDPALSTRHEILAKYKDQDGADHGSIQINTSVNSLSGIIITNNQGNSSNCLRY